MEPPAYGDDDEARMSVTVTIVGPCSQNTTPSILVQTTQHRYLFNAGDGLQRCCNEYKIRLSKLDKLLFTRLTADSLGGLCGLLLTLGDAVATRDPKIDIYGPKSISRFIYSLRHFFRRPNMTISVHEVESPSRILTGDDPNLDIIPLITSHIIEASESPESSEAPKKRFKVSTENESPYAYLKSLPKKFGILNVESTKLNPETETKTVNVSENSSKKPQESIACSYLIRAKASRGKFLTKKAIQLGVTPGPDFGKLTR